LSRHGLAQEFAESRKDGGHDTAAAQNALRQLS
jgi:hypothetical protein